MFHLQFGPSFKLVDVRENLSDSGEEFARNRLPDFHRFENRTSEWLVLHDRNIMFASNYDSVTKQTVQYITSFAATIQAKIHFVNIKKAHSLPEEKEKDWDQLIVELEPGLSFEKRTIYADDTVDRLKKYSEENHIDLLAFVSKHRNFWENLMHKSITENMAISSLIPMMVIHIDDNESK